MIDCNEGPKLQSFLIFIQPKYAGLVPSNPQNNNEYYEAQVNYGQNQKEDVWQLWHQEKVLVVGLKQRVDL